jgi:hypothetical protein
MPKTIGANGWMATRRFIGVDPTGSERLISMRIGRPYKISDDEWACPAATDGLVGRHPDVHGGDALQALCLGISLVRSVVEDFLEKGGRLLDRKDKTEWLRADVAAVFGSVAKRQDVAKASRRR